MSVDKTSYKKEWRANNPEKPKEYCKKYEKTFNGYLMRMYRNMKSRVTGVQSKKAHLYQGKELMDKELFYEFAKCSPMFRTLFYQYEKSGYDQKLAPTPDRIDSTKGYSIENIQWVSNSVNSRRGATSKRKKLNENTAT